MQELVVRVCEMCWLFGKVTVATHKATSLILIKDIDLCENHYETCANSGDVGHTYITLSSREVVETIEDYERVRE
jgi:hypothetical protein